MKWHTINEVAKIVNRSRQAVYKKIKRLTLEEKLALGNNLMEDGQILLSNEGIKSVFNLTTNDNQVAQPVVGQVDKVDIQVVKTTEKVDIQVDTEVVATLRNQLTDKEKEVVRLDNLMKNLLSQLEEERRQRGEDRIRTDTILMKLTNDISTMQKALEYKKAEPPMEIIKKEVASEPVKRTPAPIRAEVVEPVQVKVSAWNSLRSVLDDVTGFVFGLG